MPTPRRTTARRPRSAGSRSSGVSEHVYRFTAALDVWQHPLWVESAGDDIDDYCEFVRSQTDLRLGIEADFIPGREDRMRALLDARDWDYVVGSIHFLADGALDYDRFDVWNSGRSADHVWRTYFTWLGEAARSGMFDILAHPDLVKYWGVQRPGARPRPALLLRPGDGGIADSGIAVEVSTAGLRKPVGEIYPSPAFLEMVIDAGNPIALSSDAHAAERPRLRLRRGAGAAGRAGRRRRSRRSTAARGRWWSSDEHAQPASAGTATAWRPASR